MATGNYERCNGGQPQIRVAGLGGFLLRDTRVRQYTVARPTTVRTQGDRAGVPVAVGVRVTGLETPRRLNYDGSRTNSVVVHTLNGSTAFRGMLINRQDLIQGGASREWDAGGLFDNPDRVRVGAHGLGRVVGDGTTPFTGRVRRASRVGGVPVAAGTLVWVQSVGWMGYYNVEVLTRSYTTTGIRGLIRKDDVWEIRVPSSPEGQTGRQDYGRSFLGLGDGNTAVNAPATPTPTRAYEDPSTWGSAVHDTLTAAADLARAARGEPRVSDEEVGTDYSVPPDEESFFSTTGGKVLLFGGIGLAVLGLVFFLKKDKSAAAVKENRRRRNRRKRNRGRGRVPMYYANCA